MACSNTLEIGDCVIDLGNPCAVAAALKRMQIQIAIGGVAKRVRIDGEEVEFSSANARALADLIRQYENACARAGGPGAPQGGARRQRFAKRFRCY